LDIRKIVLLTKSSEAVAQLGRSVGLSPSLEVAHNRVYVALKDVVRGHGGGGLEGGLDDLRGLFQP